MRFKKFRYNLIIVGLVAIIGCFIALPLITGGQSDVNQGSTIEDIANEPEIVQPEEEFENNEFEEDEEDESDFFEDMSNLELLNYSLDKLYNGKGFYSTYTQNAYNATSVMGTTVNVPQRCVGTIVRSGRNSMQESYFYSEYSGIKADELKRFYQYDYVDRDTNTFTQGQTSSYNYQNMTYDMSVGSRVSMSYDAAVAKYRIFYGDTFPIVTNPKKGDIVIAKTSGNYKTIEVTYNVKNVPNCVKEVYGITGQLKNINYQSLKITYKINLKNGKMVSMVREEKLSAIAAGFNSVMDTKTVQNFKSVDEEQTIVQP